MFVVGDPDQSIYAWRGAHPEYLVDYDKSHKPCKTIILDQNYRSRRRILDIANSLIGKNHNRVRKNLITADTREAQAVYFHGKTEEAESFWVVKHIKKKIEAGYDINEIAVLYRATHISRPFEQAFISEGIPYIIYGGIRFFERQEIKDILAYLKLIAQDDDISFLRIINRPSRKLGKEFIKELKEQAAIRSEKLYETLKLQIASGETAKKGAVDFVNLIEKCRQKAPNVSIAGLTQDTLEASGLLEEYRQDGDENRLDNLTELVQSVRDYESRTQHESGPPLERYLQDISLYTNIDYKDDKGVLKLMTVHQAKGMEFDVVFIVGMTEGVFPNHRSIRENGQAALEEERRLAYVAVTRAKKELYISESEGFSHEGIEKYPSRFIFEIEPENLLAKEGFVSAELKNGLRRLINQLNFPVAGTQNVSAGTGVTHPVFGKGRITSGDGKDFRIYFENLQKEKTIKKDFQGLVFNTPDRIENMRIVPQSSAPAPQMPDISKTPLSDEAKNIAEGRGKWSVKNIPHEGWVCIDIEDMGHPALVCEMCEAQTIRYVHYMRHKDYPAVLKVGCVCAGNMEGNAEHAKKRDEFMRSRSDKRKRWLNHHGWKTSKKGNNWIRAENYVVVMKQRDSYWSALIKNGDSMPSFEQWINREYPSKNEAKLAAFDFLTKLLAEKNGELDKPDRKKV